MSLWLKRRAVMWCALAMLLGGGWWFSSVRAQNEWPPPAPPAKTPEAAGERFPHLLAAGIVMDGQSHGISFNWPLAGAYLGNQPKEAVNFQS